MYYYYYNMRTSLMLLLITVGVTAQADSGPSPESEFLTQPSNVTVPVGEPAILKCMIASKAHICRWYFLELGLNFFEKRITPMLVKEFSPAGQQDCSIIIKKAKKIQEGQWLCQALKFQSSKFIMTKPATLRVITEAESATWEPPKDSPIPRGGRRGDDTELDLQFELTDDDIIQDVFIHERAVLKCQVNQPITSCSWINPNGENVTVIQDKTNPDNKTENEEFYKVIGNLEEGNCSLEIPEVAYHNEGNWRCVIRTLMVEEDKQGPLLHLHILDQNSASKHTHDGTEIADDHEETVSFLVISLVVVSGILFIIVLLLLMFLYRRLKGTSDETQRILRDSPRSSMDLPKKMIPVTDLTSASVMAVEPRKKLPFYDDHYSTYNQYLDMSGSESTNGYVMMPGSSIRSSTSSRTTLSTLSTFPIGRSRSASNSTTDSGVFPHLTTIIDNPSYNPDADPHRNRLSRHDSVYSNDHVYEEIKEKIEEIVNKMEKIPEADSPTYTNINEDSEGYMIPKKSPSSEQLNKKDPLVHFKRDPLPDPPSPTNTEELIIQLTDEDEERPPPYSTVGEIDQTPEIPLGADPGYSKVGNDTQNPEPDPMERYDIPRPLPNNPTDSYDVPRQNPIPVNQPTTEPIQTEVIVDGLTGIIV